MPCVWDIDLHFERDILRLPPGAKQEVAHDLVALQDDPLPRDRADLGRPYGYFHQLPSGYYVSWELLGEEADLVHLILTGVCRNITIRFLGVGTDSPGKK